MTIGVQLVAGGAVQRIALAEDVARRVDHLRALAGRVASSYLDLADALFVGHADGLWQRARSAADQRYPKRRGFLGRRRWTQAAERLSTRGHRQDADEPRAARRRPDRACGRRVAQVGHVGAGGWSRHQQPDAVRTWTAMARTETRAVLRERVRVALGWSRRPRSDASARFQSFLIDAMPDLETRTLATEFFAVGETYVGSNNATAIVIAAMEEALGTWMAHLGSAPDDQDDASTS